MASKVFSNTIMQYFYVAARYVFPLLTLPYLARVFGPDTYGVRAYIVSLVLFFQTIADFGFNLSGAKAIVPIKEKKNPCSQVLSAILFSKLAILAVLFLAIILMAVSIPIVCGEIYCVLVAYFGMALNTLVPDFIFIGKEEMGVITTRYVVSKLLATVLIFVLVRSTQDLLLSFVVDALGSLVAFGLSWVQIKKKYGLQLRIPDSSECLDSIRRAIPFFLNNASVAGFNALATVFVGIFLNDAVQVAYWSLSITALNAILSLYNPISNALYPHMVHTPDFRLFTKLIVAGTVAASIGAVLFALCSNCIMWVLGGGSYIKGSYVLVLLSPVLLLAYPALMLGNPLLGARNMERELAISSLISVAAYVLLMLALVCLDCFSLAGVAICRCSAELILLLTRFLMVKRKKYNF